MSHVDGTDLSKVTGEALTAAAVSAVAPIVVKKAGWFISQVAAIALAIVMPLVGFFIGRGVERSAVAAVEAVSGGSGSGSGSAATPELQTVPYDAKSVAAEAVVGPLSGTGEATHPAHPADAAVAAEADTQ